MEKRLATVLMILLVLTFTLVATLTVFFCIIDPGTPVIVVGVSVTIVIASLLVYFAVKAIIRHEQEYRGADYAAMIDSITGGVLVLDGNDCVYTVSDDAKGYLGLSDYAIGMPKELAVKDSELQRCITEAKKGVSSLTEYSYKGVTLRVLVDPVIFNNTIVGTMLLFLDMGEQLNIEKIKREFAANVSHELKTPLTSISGYAEMIANGLVEPKDVTDFANRIHAESKRLLTLIGDIIRLSRLDEGGGDSAEDVDIAEIADECCDVLHNSAGNAEVRLAVDAEPLIVRGDRSLLTELVYNLIDNGIRYNRPGGSVNIIIKEKKLVVRDTGIGIEKEHHARIFERFYRVDKSRSKRTGGTGLGLAIVKHVAERYNAKVILSSEIGVGTEVTVEFP